MTHPPLPLSGALVGLALLFPAVVSTVTAVGSLMTSAPMPSVSIDMVLLQLGIGVVYSGGLALALLIVRSAVASNRSRVDLSAFGWFAAITASVLVGVAAGAVSARLVDSFTTVLFTALVTSLCSAVIVRACKWDRAIAAVLSAYTLVSFVGGLDATNALASRESVLSIVALVGVPALSLVSSLLAAHEG